MEKLGCISENNEEKKNNSQNISLKRESLLIQKKNIIFKKKKANSLLQNIKETKNIYTDNRNNKNKSIKEALPKQMKKIKSVIIEPKDINANSASNKSKKEREKEKDKDKDKSSALEMSVLNKENSYNMEKIFDNNGKSETKETKHEHFLEFFINNNAKNKSFKYNNNTIFTTKFNFFTFIPKGLLYQFSRLSNVYFLFTAIIQSIPLISPLTSITAIVPLIFVLGVSMIRELIEDLARHKYDNLNNEEEVIVLRDNQFVKSANKTLRHGEIILIYENQGIPADMILIDTTFKEGICYVETSSLDGEKTLKLKVANKYTQGFLSRKYSKINKGLENLIEKDKYQFDGHVRINYPNADLNYVNGTFHPILESEDLCIEKDIIINNTGFLLKGSILKNTNWIIGVVVYTGMENKIILNAKKPRLKISKIEKRLNYYLLYVFLFLILCCSFCSVFHHIQYKKNLNFYNNFILIENDHKFESFIVFFTYFLLLNTFIPISLVVSTEIIKMIQGIIISWDIMLYSRFRHTFCKVKTFSIIEELGNVNFIFSDKTGTLTKNQLQFRYCIIDNKYYEYEKLGRRKRKVRNNNKERKIKRQKTIHTTEIVNSQKGILTEPNKNILLKNKYISDEDEVIKNREGIIAFNDNYSSKNSNNKSIEKKDILLRQKSFFSGAKSKILSKFIYSPQNNNSINSNKFNYKNINNINNNTITISSHTINGKNDKKDINSNIIILESKNEENELSSYNNEIIKIGEGYFINPKINTFLNDVNEENPDKNNTFNYINEFWTALALTNECMIKYEKDEIKYMCTSPDDLELVKTAKSQGYKLIETSIYTKTLKIGDKRYKYEILKVLGFSSERKRMSIIVKNESGIKLYIKGADCEITKRLSKKSLKNENLQVISNGLMEFSRRGLRTLMVAFRKINEDDYKSWLKQLHKDELNMKKKQKLIYRLYDIIEKNLTLLGGTAVEDELQDNVPETIKEIRSAGIKMWVLTGDKLDTAENIGHSCNLISKEQKTFVMKMQTDEEEVKKDPFQEINKFFFEFQQYIDSLVKKYNLDVNLMNNDGNNSIKSNNNYNQLNIMNDLNKNQSEMSNSFSSKSSVVSCINFEAFQNLKEKNMLEPFNIIIEAPILNGLFRDDEQTENFMKVAYYSNAVICCRVSPFQKSLIVQKMKEFDSNTVTMAIGDGGNDVAMIMEANIGIGIVGEEGNSAVQASDFAFGEFQILKRLLFYHGRNNLYRISKMILYFFYKNFIFTIVQYYFSFICLASGQTIIDDWYITGFNLLFTALPLCIRAITDSDIDIHNKLIMKNLPLLYRENRDEYKIFNFKNFILNVFKGMVIALFIYLTGFQNTMLINGFNKNIWYLSLSNYICILIAVSMNLLITSNFIIIFLPLSILITTFVLYGIFLILNHYGYFLVFNSKASIETSFSSFQFYISIILISCLNFIFDYSMKLVSIYFDDSLSSKFILYNKGKKKKNSFNKIITPTFIKNRFLREPEDIEFEKSNNFLVHNKSFNKINIINNNNRYLNFNILPGVGINSQNEIQNLPKFQNLNPQSNENIFKFSEMSKDINNNYLLNNDNGDYIKYNNKDIINEPEKEEK